MTKPPDRRVERTRRLLRDALVALIFERGWDEISIKDVCEKADVGRSTFYAHFGDKEELLTSGFEALEAEMRAQGEAGPDTVLRFWRPLVVHAVEHQPLFRALVGRHSGRFVERRFRKLVLTLVGEELAGRDLGDLPREATVQFVAGGMMELLSSALDARSLSVDGLDEQVQRFAARVLGLHLHDLRPATSPYRA